MNALGIFWVCFLHVRKVVYYLLLGSTQQVIIWLGALIKSVPDL